MSTSSGFKPWGRGKGANYFILLHKVTQAFAKLFFFNRKQKKGGPESGLEVSSDGVPEGDPDGGTDGVPQGVGFTRALHVLYQPLPQSQFTCPGSA